LPAPHRFQHRHQHLLHQILALVVIAQVAQAIQQDALAVALAHLPLGLGLLVRSAGNQARPARRPSTGP
jgi:hypothetical protein